LKDAGRVDEALKIWTELVDVNKQQITTLEALPKGDPKRIQLSRARMTIGNRYTQLATFFTDRKEYDRALEYVKLAEEAGGYNPLEATASSANRRADVYAKAGKPDLEIDQRIHSLAARLDPKARDKILPLLEKTGTTLEAALARAGEIRKANAVAVKGFELKALDGRTVTLDAVRSNVTLVNFFFPT
jgi:tetratricopeptide (TPR) repeat protein